MEPKSGSRTHPPMCSVMVSLHHVMVPKKQSSFELLIAMASNLLAISSLEILSRPVTCQWPSGYSPTPGLEVHDCLHSPGSRPSRPCESQGCKRHLPLRSSSCETHRASGRATKGSGAMVWCLWCDLACSGRRGSIGFEVHLLEPELMMFLLRVRVQKNATLA